VSKVGRNSEITGILNKSIDPGPLKALNPVTTGRGQKTFYCPNCYSLNLWYKQIETGVFDIVCLNCDNHFIKKKVPKNENKT